MKKNDSQKLMLAGLAVAGYFLLSNSAGATPPAKTTTVDNTPKAPSYPIKYGVYHPDVKLLQAALNVAPQDGIIGPQTLAAWSKAYNGEIQKGYEIETREDLLDWVKELAPWLTSGIFGVKKHSTLG